MAAGAPQDLTRLHRQIESARTDIAVAVEDLERATKRLATTDHWKEVAGDYYQRNPGKVLFGAAVFGFWLGLKFR